MATRPLSARIDEERLDGRIPVIVLSGELDAFAQKALQDAFAGALAENPPAILLDLTAVDYINSTGIALIVRLLSATRDRGLQLAAAGLSDHYLEIFRITRLDQYMSVYPSRAGAEAELAVWSTHAPNGGS